MKGRYQKVNIKAQHLNYQEVDLFVPLKIKYGPMRVGRILMARHGQRTRNPRETCLRLFSVAVNAAKIEKIVSGAGRLCCCSLAY